MKNEKSKINIKAKAQLKSPDGQVKEYIIESSEIEVTNPVKKNKPWSTILMSAFSVSLGFILGFGGQLYMEARKESRSTPKLNAKYLLEKIPEEKYKYVELVKGATMFFNPERSSLVRSSFRHLLVVYNNSRTAKATNVKLTVKVSPPASIYAIASEEYKPNPFCGSNYTKTLIELGDLDIKKEAFIQLGIAFPESGISSLKQKGTISMFLESENKGSYRDIFSLFQKTL